MEFNKQQQRVCQTLSEAVATLCKNMLHFQSDITVQGLLGITLDQKNVILVNIAEQVPGPGYGLDPETVSDVKEFEGLGDASLLEKVFPKDWNSDVYRETLSLSRDKNGVDNNLFVKEEPVAAAAISGQSTDNSSTEKTVLNKPWHKGKQMPASTIEESPRGKALSLSIKYLGSRDTLLPMEQDLPTLDDISSHLSSQALDYSGQLSLSPSKASNQDLSEDYLSVKEELDPFTSDLIEQCQGVLGTQDVLDQQVDLDQVSMPPDIADADFDDVSSVSADDKFPCPNCGLVFAHKRSLRRHSKLHEGMDDTWRCDLCPQVFKRKDILQRHIKKHHTINKQLKCPLCQKMFSRHDSMRRHMIMAHTSGPESRIPTPIDNTELTQ